MNIKTANRLCELRKEHGLSQEELANKLGVSRQAISKWERSESSPDTDNLIELARLYNISLDELLNGEEAMDVIKENKEAEQEEQKEDKVEFNDDSIHVCSEDEEVYVGKDGVHVKDDEGNEVHVNKKYIQFKDDDDNTVVIEGDTVRVTDENGNEKVYSRNEWRKMQHKNSLSGIITSIVAISVIVAYLLLGFLANGFAIYWFLFILIPVPGSLYEAIAKRKAKRFAYPVLVAGVYCALGVFLNLWHPGWVVFITIPLYYAVIGLIHKIKQRG